MLRSLSLSQAVISLSSISPLVANTSKNKLNCTITRVCSVQLIAQYTYTKPPPSSVWRLDSRKPEVIFRDGFIAYGNNQNLLDHVEGIIVKGEYETSNFISTTSTPEAAFKIVDGMFKAANPPEEIFQYKIRADHNFFDINTSLHLVRSSSPNYSRASALLLQHGWQEEYAVQGSIPPEQIISAYPVIKKDGQIIIQTEKKHINSNYVNAQTHANSKPFPIWGNEEPLEGCFPAVSRTIKSMADSIKKVGSFASKPWSICNKNQAIFSKFPCQGD